MTAVDVARDGAAALSKLSAAVLAVGVACVLAAVVIGLVRPARRPASV